MAKIPCIECNTLIDNSLKSCPECGCPITVTNLRECPECKSIVSFSLGACPECGFPSKLLNNSAEIREVTTGSKSSESVCGSTPIEARDGEKDSERIRNQTDIYNKNIDSFTLLDDRLSRIELTITEILGLTTNASSNKNIVDASHKENNTDIQKFNDVIANLSESFREQLSEIKVSQLAALTEVSKFIGCKIQENEHTVGNEDSINDELKLSLSEVKSTVLEGTESIVIETTAIKDILSNTLSEIRDVLNNNASEIENKYESYQSDVKSSLQEIKKLITDNSSVIHTSLSTLKDAQTTTTVEIKKMSELCNVTKSGDNFIFNFISVITIVVLICNLLITAYIVKLIK